MTTKKTRVEISRDGVVVGHGRWTDDHEIVDCPAILGDDQDDSDETYEALAEALAALQQTEERWRGPITVERPDGAYTVEVLQ